MHGGAAADSASSRRCVRLAAADAVDVGDALAPACRRRERAVASRRAALELGQRDHAVDAVAELALGAARSCRSRWRRRSSRPRRGSSRRLDVARSSLVVAEAAGLADHLGVREDGDVGPLPDLSAQALDQLAAVLAVRVHLAEAADPAAELRLPLDEERREADVGEADGRAQAGDAAADHERAGVVSTTIGSSGSVSRVPRDAGADEPDRLARRALVVVGVRPRALLADVHLRVLVRVQARRAWRRSRNVNVCSFGEQEATTRPSSCCSSMSSTISCWVASEQVNIARRATTHAGLVLDRVDHRVDVDVVGDVAAAVADVDADAVPSRSCGHLPPLPRCAAACATAAPACRIDSGMSLAPEAAPATKTPGMLVSRRG